MVNIYIGCGFMYLHLVPEKTISSCLARKIQHSRPDVLAYYYDDVVSQINKVKMIINPPHLCYWIVFFSMTSSHQVWMTKMNPFLPFMASNLMACLYLVIFSSFFTTKDRRMKIETNKWKTGSPYTNSGVYTKSNKHASQFSYGGVQQTCK